MVMVEKTSESNNEEQHEGGGNKYDITFTPRREEMKEWRKKQLEKRAEESPS